MELIKFNPCNNNVSTYMCIYLYQLHELTHKNTYIHVYVLIIIIQRD